ncbi:abortive infection system toxin AbiGii family protein [Bacillus cereus]|uniref:abortive infection system toxin AbiGii family protein n=1 Tax=Bacillus cereus TaxID=1396 RepID=UPI000BF9F072|nr:abortive infection system toxin AbiGii family protein [Bacillus cereus]PEX67021.1 abortive phage resistance protein [Bacillus cereus]
MFSNFKQAFKKDESKNAKIPQAVLDALSEDLPKGLKYVPIDNQQIKAVPEEGNEIRITISSLKVKLPDGLKLNSPEELQEFLYRTQQKVQTDGESIKINGEKKPLSELIKKPFQPQKIIPGKIKYEIEPQPFPEPNPLEVTYEEMGITKVFHVKRQPLADMKKSLFKTIDSDPIEIIFTIDEEDSSVAFNVNMMLSKVTSVEEIIKTIELYKGFLNGKVKLADVIQTPIMNEVDGIDSIDDALRYWEKVSAIGKKLQLEFNPQEEIDEKGLLLVDRLYKSLIENAPYKMPVMIEKFTTTTSEALNKSEFSNGKSMAFQYKNTEIFTLYGVKFNIFSAVALLNCKISNIETVETNKYKFNIEPAYGDSIEQASKHFISQEELDKFFTPPSSALEALSKAEDL